MATCLPSRICWTVPGETQRRLSFVGWVCAARAAIVRGYYEGNACPDGQASILIFFHRQITGRENQTWFVIPSPRTRVKDLKSTTRAPLGNQQRFLFRRCTWQLELFVDLDLVTPH